MLKIGDIRIPGKTVLGPMSGYTSVSYRGFMRKFGANVAVTEMISARGLLDDPVRCSPYLQSAEGQVTGAQMTGSIPEVMAEGAALALRINPNLSFIDINMGCPVPKIVHRGAGSALMSDPARCGDIIHAVKRAVNVPVTCKMRLGRGWDSINFRTVAEEVVSSGVDAVMIHSRTADQRYSGSVMHDMVKDLGRDLSIPVVISGNIFTPEGALNAIAASGADAVIVARGGVGNPYLVTQIEHLLNTGIRLDDPKVSRQMDWCKELIVMAVEEMGTHKTSRKLKTTVLKFLSLCPHCSDYREQIIRDNIGVDDMLRVLDDVKERFGDEMTVSVMRESA